MKQKVFYTILFGGVLLILFSILSQKSLVVHHEALRFESDPQIAPVVSARAWAIGEVSSGEIIVGNDVDSVLPIASLTKLMTALVAVENYDLSEETTVTQKAVWTEGRAGRLKAGQVYPLRELLFPLLIESSNDAGEVLAAHNGRDLFIDTMNFRGEELGMHQSVFADPSGLSRENTSSVHDMMILYTHIFHNERRILDVSMLSQYLTPDRGWVSNNPATGIDTFIGGKNGYIPEAGNTFVGGFREVIVSGEEGNFLLVLLGSDDIEGDISALRTYIHEHMSLKN